MKYFAGIFCLLAALVLEASSQSVPKDLLSVPARLELDKPTMEVKAGTTVSYTVSLRDAADQPIAANKDLVLDVNTPSGQQSVVLPKGKSSVNFSWQATTAGVAQTTVRSEKLHPASGLVLVAPKPISELMLMPIRPAVAEAGHFAGRPAAASPGAAPGNAPPLAVERQAKRPLLAERAAIAGLAGNAPAAAPPVPQATKLQMFVTPLPVYGSAVAHTWMAAISLAAVGEGNGFVPVTTPVAVHFTSGFGQVSPADITLEPGQISTFDKPVVLTASRAGKDAVQAISSFGTLGPVEVDYLLPPATQLRISLGTAQVLASGSSSVTVQVCILDDSGVLTVSAEAVNIVLSAAGQFSKQMVPIAANSSCSEMVTWTAAKPGPATVFAESTGLPKTSANIVFPAFPWYLVWLAALGGLVGALIANTDDLLSARWWGHTWRSLMVGAILGVIVYLLARFGALVLPKNIPITIQNIPVVSGAGSFVLGFIGGVYGRRLLKVGDDQQAPQPPVAAARGAGGPD